MIRAGKESDIPSIQSIGRAVGLFNYGFLYKVLIQQNLLFIVEVDALVVGYVVAFPLFLKQGFCLQIGVSKSHQGLGVGTDLMQFIENYMRDTYSTYRLFAHTIKDSSLAYFAKKLSYRPWFRVLGLTIIYKKVA
jgi:ribosomal protein S18 acetylase RimI-like enzyme